MAPDQPAPPRGPKRVPGTPPRESNASQRTDSKQRLGREGEALAADFLEARGYRIVAHNVRADRVEIDLIARRGPLLVIIEVKTRRSNRYGSAAEAVDGRKQQRLRRGARAWLVTQPESARGWRRLRFDVVTCTKRPAKAARPSTAHSATGHPPASGAPNETTAPDGARWWIEHWKSAF